MKDDEQRLLIELHRLGFPREDNATTVGVRLGIHPKRTEYILRKWERKRWWWSGVSTRSGWLDEAGRQAAIDLGK